MPLRLLDAAGEPQVLVLVLMLAERRAKSLPNQKTSSALGQCEAGYSSTCQARADYWCGAAVSVAVAVVEPYGQKIVRMCDPDAASQGGSTPLVRNDRLGEKTLGEQKLNEKTE